MLEIVIAEELLSMAGRFAVVREAKLLNDYGITNSLVKDVAPILKRIGGFAKRDMVNEIASIEKKFVGSLESKAKRLPKYMKDALNGFEYKMTFRNIKRGSHRSLFWQSAKYIPMEKMVSIEWNTYLPLTLMDEDFWVGAKKKFINDVGRFDLSIRHEVTHAVRDAETGHITTFVDTENNDPKVKELYEGPRGHLEVEFEIDAIINSFDLLRRKLGKKKWNKIGPKEIMEIMPGTKMPLRGDKILRKWVNRLIRENLLTDEMKRQWT